MEEFQIKDLVIFSLEVVLRGDGQLGKELQTSEKVIMNF